MEEKIRVKMVED